MVTCPWCPVGKPGTGTKNIIADGTRSIILSILFVCGRELTEILTVFRKTGNLFINTQCIDLVICLAYTGR